MALSASAAAGREGAVDPDAARRPLAGVGRCLRSRIPGPGGAWLRCAGAESARQRRLRRGVQPPSAQRLGRRRFPGSHDRDRSCHRERAGRRRTAGHRWHKLWRLHDQLGHYADGPFKAAVSRNGVSSLPSAALLSDQTVWFNLCLPDEALQRNRSPLTFADRITTPLLLLHAENDLRCPFSESLQLFVALRKRKHLVELVRYPHVSHLMDWPEVGTPRQRVDRLRRTLEWFTRFL